MKKIESRLGTVEITGENENLTASLRYNGKIIMSVEGPEEFIVIGRLYVAFAVTAASFHQIMDEIKQQTNKEEKYN